MRLRNLLLTRRIRRLRAIWRINARRRGICRLRRRLRVVGPILRFLVRFPHPTYIAHAVPILYRFSALLTGVCHPFTLCRVRGFDPRKEHPALPLRVLFRQPYTRSCAQLPNIVRSIYTFDGGARMYSLGKLHATRLMIPMTHPLNEIGVYSVLTAIRTTTAQLSPCKPLIV